MTEEELKAQQEAEAAAKAKADAEAAEAKRKADEAAAGAKKPTDAEAALLKEVMQKKERLEKLEAEVKANKAVMDQLTQLGGLDQLQKLVAEQKAAEEKALEAKGEWERLKERMAEEHRKALEAATGSQSEISQKLTKALEQINELTIGQAFNTSAFIKDDLVYTPTKTRVLYGAHFDLVDGHIVGYDKPRGEANRTPLVNASGNPVSFEEALKKIVEADPEKDTILRSKIRPGAGSSSRTTAQAGRQPTAGLSGRERISAALERAGK